MPLKLCPKYRSQPEYLTGKLFKNLLQCFLYLFVFRGIESLAAASYTWPSESEKCRGTLSVPAPSQFIGIQRHCSIVGSILSSGCCYVAGGERDTDEEKESYAFPDHMYRTSNMTYGQNLKLC